MYQILIFFFLILGGKTKDEEVTRLTDYEANVSD